MADLGHQMTDEKLEQLERSVHKTYKEAYKEMQDKVDAYFDRLKDRDEEQKALLEAGKITEQQYQQWRLTQYARGERYRALRDEFARRMNEANKVAAAYINDQTPGIYSLNANYTAYTIEQSGSAVDFNLIQEQAVKRLIEEEPELFHRPAIDTPLDTVWNQRKLTDSLTAGILMGESTRQIADRFQKVTDMNRTSALRNARTAVTGAQNAGRQATYDRARAMGIEVDERWRSARDFRVRDSHRLMDGKPKDKDGYFHTPLGSIMRYPGDMQNGKAADVYNCRCTTSTKDALEAEPTMMRARDPVTGRNELVQDMTYQEWYEWKESDDKEAFIAELLNKNRKAAEESKKKQFIFAKTIQEAEEFARNHGVKYVNYGSLPLDTANKLNEALSTLPDGVTLLSVSDSKQLESWWGGKLKRKAKDYYGVTIEDFDGIHLGIGNFDGLHDHGQMVAISSHWKDLRRIKKEKESFNLRYFNHEKYQGHTWFFNETGDTVPMHEIGHAYANIKGLPPGFEWDAMKWANDSKCDMLKNPSEAWAEAWASYHTGINVDKIPEYILDYIRRVAKQ